MQGSILKLIKKNQLEDKQKADGLDRFVDDEVLRIVRESSTYKYIRLSEREDLSDVTLTLVAGHLFCYLRNKYRKKCFTHRDLCKIVVIAAQKIKCKSQVD